MIVWRFLTFEHNAHEVPLAAETARQLGVDQFVTATPFDVTWDVPDIHVADIAPVDLLFNPNATASIYDNWNANPDGLNAAVIERTFDAPWVDPSSHTLLAEAAESAGPGFSCKWLYMSMSMDAGGRIFPCCGSPRPDADLVFAQIDGASGIEAFNSEKYRMSRLSFADMDAFRKERERGRLEKDPHCAKCDWNKEPNTSSDNIRQYFLAVNRTLFNRESLAVLSSW